MRTRLHEALQRTGDRGSVSLWVVIFAFVTLALLILIVDGGQVIVAKSRAADIAQQAARAAADDINPAALRNGDVTIAAGACDGVNLPSVVRARNRMKAMRPMVSLYNRPPIARGTMV